MFVPQALLYGVDGLRKLMASPPAVTAHGRIDSCDNLSCVLHALPADEQGVCLLHWLMLVSKRWRSTIVGILRWDSAWMACFRGSASVAPLVAVRETAVRATVADLMVNIRTVRTMVEGFFRGIRDIQQDRPVVYADFALVYTASLRRVMYYLNPGLDEDSVRLFVARNVLDPIIYDQDCAYKCAMRLRLERLHQMVEDREPWLQFMTFLVREHGSVAVDMMTRYNHRFAVILMSDEVSAEEVQCVLRLEQTVGVRVFYNDSDSHVHWVCHQAFISKLAIKKIRMISDSYGPEFLKWIPKNDMYIQCTMVTTFLENAYVRDRSPMQESALVYLINACPGALGIVNVDGGFEPGMATTNAFSWVVDNCVDPCEDRLVMIARMVMQHASLADMRRVHNGKRDIKTCNGSPDRTLLAMVVERGNRFVAQIITEIFAGQLTGAELAFLRTLE